MLDFTRLSKQVNDFTRLQTDAHSRFRVALQEAGRRLREAPTEWEATRQKIAEARTSWLLAGWTEPPDTVASAPPRPERHRILSADGSQIVPDRHDAAECYVLNVGTITLPYGVRERPALTTTPAIYAVDDEMLEDTPDGATQFSGKRLSIKRFLAECEALASLTEAQSSETPALALFDGSLILWTLEPEADAFREKSLQTFFAALTKAQKNGVPLVGYISSPQSKDVVNSLKVWACPAHKGAKCDQHCKYRLQRLHPLYVVPECAGVERVTDAQLFAAVLKPGERSAVFESSSKILAQYPDRLKTRFFYLHTGAEVARIELPRWVTEEAGLLAQVHALAYDQACKGGGYPVALAEAHELAIVRGAERDAFFQLLARQFRREKLPLGGTQKSLAKRARRV